MNKWKSKTLHEKINKLENQLKIEKNKNKNKELEDKLSQLNKISQKFKICQRLIQSNQLCVKQFEKKIKK